MENIYKKIEAIFDDDMQEKPKWADEILDELREIKTLLKEQKKSIKKIDRNFYSFVKSFRETMKADVANNIYPTFYYNGKRYGIDFNGLVYNKENSEVVPREEAYSVYRYAYEHKDELKVFK
jgi:hypothetical protein